MKVTEQPIVEVIEDAEKNIGNVMVVNQDVAPVVLVPGDLVGEVGPPDQEAVLMREWGPEGSLPTRAAGRGVGWTTGDRL